MEQPNYLQFSKSSGSVRVVERRKVKLKLIAVYGRTVFVHPEVEDSFRQQYAAELADGRLLEAVAPGDDESSGAGVGDEGLVLTFSGGNAPKVIGSNSVEFFPAELSVAKLRPLIAACDNKKLLTKLQRTDERPAVQKACAKRLAELDQESEG